MTGSRIGEEALPAATAGRPVAGGPPLAALHGRSPLSQAAVAPPESAHPPVVTDSNPGPPRPPVAREKLPEATSPEGGEEEARWAEAERWVEDQAGDAGGFAKSDREASVPAAGVAAPGVAAAGVETAPAKAPAQREMTAQDLAELESRVDPEAMRLLRESFRGQWLGVRRTDSRKVY